MANSKVTRLAHWRHDKGWTQLDLAVRSRVAISRISRIENAQTWDDLATVSVGKLVQLADALGLPAYEVFPRLGRAA